MKDYHSTHLVTYEEPHSQSSVSIPQLPFLRGLPWDQFALNWVHSLRPSCIRVTKGDIKCDARSWRVTVYVDEKDIILGIEQECDVGCEGYRHGHDLLCKLPEKNLKEFDKLGPSWNNEEDKDEET